MQSELLSPDSILTIAGINVATTGYLGGLKDAGRSEGGREIAKEKAEGAITHYSEYSALTRGTDKKDDPLGQRFGKRAGLGERGWGVGERGRGLGKRVGLGEEGGAWGKRMGLGERGGAWGRGQGLGERVGQQLLRVRGLRQPGQAAQMATLFSTMLGRRYS